MFWLKRFSDPIMLPDGRTLRTLRDAADYIDALPSAEREKAKWILAMQALRLAAERADHLTLARTVMIKALETPPDPPLPCSVD